MHAQAKQEDLSRNVADDLIKSESVEEVETAQSSAREKNIVLAQQMSEQEFLEAEKRLKRKLDVRLMAPIVFIYILNYLDRSAFLTNDTLFLTIIRNNIAAAKVAGIEASLKLTATQFSTAVSILFAGYVLASSQNHTRS